MFAALKQIFSAPSYQQEAHALYVNIVAEARTPKFYTDYAVPDTLDGRFDMITLVMFTVIDRLKKENTEQSLEFLRTLSEVFFSDMDRSLREMGSTDTGVGKRIKKMSQAFYGRLLAYQAAGSDASKMHEALLRNLYRGDLEKLSAARMMNDYVLEKRQQLAAKTVAEIIAASEAV